MSFFNTSFNNEEQCNNDNLNTNNENLQPENIFGSFQENQAPAFGINNNMNASFGGDDEQDEKMNEECFEIYDNSFNMDINQNKSVSQDTYEAVDLQIPHEIISYANSLRNPNNEMHTQETQSYNNKILDFIKKIKESSNQHSNKFAKMQIEQKEFKYKLVLEHSKRSLLIQQNIFNKKIESNKILFFDKISAQVTKNKTDYNLLSKKSELILEETNMSMKLFLEFFEMKQSSEIFYAFTQINRHSEIYCKKNSCISRIEKGNSEFAELQKALDKKESELTRVVSSTNDEIQKVTQQNEMLIQKLDEYQSIGEKQKELAKQNKDYDDKQKKLEEEINRNSRYKRQLKVNESGIKKFTKEMIRIQDSHDKENSSISIIQQALKT